MGVLVMFVWMVGRILGRSRRQCALWAAALVIAYALLTEPSPAVFRSAIMAVVFCITILARRPLRSVNSLAAAAIILLIIQPTQLFDAGFQLSFLTLLAVMYLAGRVHADAKWVIDKLLRRDDPLLQPHIQYMLNPPSRTRRTLDHWRRQLGWAVAMSVAAWMAGACLSSHYFRQVPPWGWANTVIVTIPMSAVLLLGLVKTVLSAVFPELAIVLGWPLEKLTDALIWLIHLLDRLPGSGSPSPEVPGWLAAAGVATLMLWVVAPPLRIRWQWVAGAMGGFAVLAVWNLLPHASGDALRAEVLSVGDGMACVIRMPDGRTMIYDLGARPPYDMQRWTIGPFLAHERIRSIDTLVMSHPQLDHISGVPDLLDRFTVREAVTSPYFNAAPKAGNPARRLSDELHARAFPWRTVMRGDRLNGDGDATVEVLWPPRREDLDIRDENNASLILRISYANRRILLCGDISEAAEQRLLLTRDLGADVLVLPHHGGVVRTTEAFIRAVNPAWCIRSSGQSDRETTNGLLELMSGKRYLNTADRGAVEIVITPADLSVRPFR